jgi:hypothetical protein
VETESLQDGDQIVHVAELAVDRFALAIAAHIVPDDLIVPGKRSELVIPLTAVGHAGMDHDQG